MNGFYSIWSRPYLNNTKEKEFWMHDYDILTMVLSNEMWKKHNGKTMIIADKEALSYLDSKNLLELFDNGHLELEVDKTIDSHMFWAAGKLFALKMLKEPTVMIDLDLIIWKNIDNMLFDSDILVIHREENSPNIYPDFELFELKDGYNLPKDFDKEVLPCNTALLYVKDIEFLNKYCDQAIEFMNNCVSTGDNLNRMVFAEQRLISIMAKKYNKEIKSVFPLASDIGVQDYFTHVWGHKNILKYNYEERKNFCLKIMKRLYDEFPDTYTKMSKMYEMQEYLVI